ncbi:hypothetical protein SUGI_0548090 [Cryptomeria japonica]|uniref:uncharacterized protein LOC131875657 n=1 Tax=Cryptomeria japonica TaxID=3369 RepID=UPI002408B0B3|nr:uncharacterized protein LOC131875657 [Cryptomeria japonica]GLJ27910.1 hypothetical protein SUGI_0548090 [Cryptomeria japonica]
MVSNVDRASQEESDSVMVEPAHVQAVVFDEITPDSTEVKQSTAPDLRLDQSPVTNNSKYATQVTMAVAFAGGSFAVMSQIPGGVKNVGRAVMDNTIGFNLFLVANMVALHASLAVGMIVATVSHISAEMEYLISMSLWAAAVCFDLTFHAALYVVLLPKHRWIVLCSGAAVTIALACLLLHRFYTTLYQVSAIWDGFLRRPFFKRQQGMASQRKIIQLNI